ncbi:hypothetical protein F5Y16DRAFT_401588 [Xylariaceae sp. FL0255]|nr:hypothetical protein F5Y16DRAFT_401588 [Xylariaceae sp. FL0255]
MALSPTHCELLGSSTSSLRPTQSHVLTKGILGTKRLRKPLSWQWWWWWEIGAVILSILSSQLIILLLFKINDWVFPIRPNSVLSVLTTVTKTTLLAPIASCLSQLKWRHFSLDYRPLDELQVFDDASRGPSGSIIMLFEFLFNTRKSRVLLSISLAIVNILALGIDASTQQIVRLKDREVKAASPLVITSRAEAYFSRAWNIGDPGLFEPHINGLGTFPGARPFSDVEFSRESVLLSTISYDAMFNAGPKPFFKCPPNATNCTWDDFSTLGVCARYRNVTESAQQTCVSQKQNYQQHGEALNKFKVTCNFSMQGLYHPRHEEGSADNVSMEWEYYMSETHQRHNLTVDIFNIQQLQSTASLASLAIVRIPNAVYGSFSGSLYTAFEASITDLFWCKKTLHKASASASSFFQADSTRMTPWGNQDGIIPMTSEAGVGYGTLNGVPYAYNLIGSPAYNISTSAQFSLGTIRRSIQDTRLRWQNSTLKSHVIVAASDKVLRPGIEGGIVGSAGRFLLTNDLELYAHILADSLTAYVLTPNGDNLNVTNVTGYMIYNDTRYEVHWSWLALLSFETFSITTLLIMTIFATKQQSLLKNSLIGLLVYTISGWKEGELNIRGPDDTLEGWKKRAKGMNAKLREDKSGMKRFYRHIK